MKKVTYLLIGVFILSGTYFLFKKSSFYYFDYYSKKCFFRMKEVRKTRPELFEKIYPSRNDCEKDNSRYLK
ncbi:MAG: hypothetical protein WC444_03935 [Candidatus Paceibacterota bacterium]